MTKYIRQQLMKMDMNNPMIVQKYLNVNLDMPLSTIWKNA